MNLLFGAFISLLGLGMGITFLMTAFFGAIALTLSDDEVQLERGNIKVSRRGKERTVANRVSKRLKIWISGGSCFGELEWFGEPGNRVPIDRRYLVPVEEETS